MRRGITTTIIAPDFHRVDMQPELPNVVMMSKVLEINPVLRATLPGYKFVMKCIIALSVNMLPVPHIMDYLNKTYFHLHVSS